MGYVVSQLRTQGSWPLRADQQEANKGAAHHHTSSHEPMMALSYCRSSGPKPLSPPDAQHATCLQPVRSISEVGGHKFAG